MAASRSVVVVVLLLLCVAACVAGQTGDVYEDVSFFEYISYETDTGKRVYLPGDRVQSDGGGIGYKLGQWRAYYAFVTFSFDGFCFGDILRVEVSTSVGGETYSLGEVWVVAQGCYGSQEVLLHVYPSASAVGSGLVSYSLFSGSTLLDSYGVPVTIEAP